MKEVVTQETPETKVRGRILAYMAPPPGFVERAPLHMRSALIVGEMGSGKTTFIEAKLGEAVQALLGQGVDDYSICYVYGKEAGIQQLLEAATSLDLDRCMYLYIFNDDAPATKGGHGRRAMSRENVSESQAYIMIRHRLKALGFNGFLLAVHASQVYHLVDITFRRMAVLKFFKSYPDEPADFRLLGPLVGGAGLMALHDLSMKLWTSNDPEVTWQTVHRAVAVLKRHRSLVRAEPEARRSLEALPQQARVEHAGGAGEEQWNDGTGKPTIQYETYVKGIKTVRRGNGIDFYLRENGTHKPLIKIRWNS
ncbi:putative ATP-binding protein [Aeropyrum globular virus 1]|uniref:putative ATP-binding protein n=1 Tax=Aeropyrum globular virus 1 TaxID=1932713 RepID=UPI000C7F7716|nr:putative ATP-binding protein [Aeropyrum globular virus 1]BBC20953.1 putative ATP-binding protein [Aeropyrum globular virus 1]